MSGSVEAAITGPLALGDHRTAATAAINAYGPQIHGYLLAVLRARPAADDAFAMFAEALWRGLPGFRGESTVRTWAYKLAWHAALRLLRDPYRRRGRRLATSEAAMLADSISTASSKLARQERVDHVRALRDALSPDERTLLVLKVDRELSWREIAEIVAVEGGAIDLAALRKRFERIKLELRALAKPAE